MLLTPQRGNSVQAWRRQCEPLDGCSPTHTGLWLAEREGGRCAREGAQSGGHIASLHQLSWCVVALQEVVLQNIHQPRLQQGDGLILADI